MSFYSTMHKLSKALLSPEVAEQQKQEEKETKDLNFVPLPLIGKEAMLDELMALNAITSFQQEKLAEASNVTTQEALQAYKRLRSLEKSSPPTGQLLRGAGVGAIAGPTAGAIGDFIMGGERGVKKGLQHAFTASARKVLARATTGATYGGALPYVKGQLEKEVEKQKLRDYVGDRKGGKLRRKLKRALGV